MRGRKPDLGTACFCCEITVRMGGAAGNAANVFLMPLPVLVWVTKEPPSINTEPMACSIVNFSCSVATASIIANGTCSWTTRSGEVDAHQLVGFVAAVAAQHEMHDALARQPGERHRREHHELSQLAKGDGHDQEGRATDRQGNGQALQHATRHWAAASGCFGGRPGRCGWAEV